MFSRRIVLSGATGLLLCGWAAPARAHREKLTQTTIDWNPQSQTLDIIHIFQQHHAETALARAGVIDRPDLYSLKARAQLALYSDDHFSLTDLDKRPVGLNLIGVETEGQRVYVYQQAELAQKPDGLRVYCQFLQHLIPGQINRVDVNLGGAVKSLQFTKSDPAKILLAN